MKYILPLYIFIASFSNANGQSATVRGMYVDGFASIIGDTLKEDSLLSYAQRNNINYLALYDLWPIHVAHPLTNVSSAAIVANFIQKAKQQYGIQQIGATGENFFFFNNVINVYNQQHSNPLQKFDVYNVEFEFWNDNTVSSGNYYCTTYLQPGGLSCDTAGAFAYYKTLIHQVDSLANANGVISEIYVGWFTQAQAITMANSVDRILLHDYISQYSGVYSYIQNRLQYLAAGNTQVDVAIIFSAEPSFLGSWLNTNPLDKGYNDVAASLNNESGTWKQYINLLGYQWFAYSFMPAITIINSVEEAEHSDFSLFPNPSSSNITIEFTEPTTAELLIYNSTGQLMFYENINQETSKNIDLSAYANGLYNCIIRSSTSYKQSQISIVR